MNSSSEFFFSAQRFTAPTSLQVCPFSSTVRLQNSAVLRRGDGEIFAAVGADAHTLFPLDALAERELNQAREGGWGQNFGESTQPGSLVRGRDGLELAGIEGVCFLFVEVGLQLFLHRFLLAIINVQHILEQSHGLLLQRVHVVGDVPQLLVRENFLCVLITRSAPG